MTAKARAPQSLRWARADGSASRPGRTPLGQVPRAAPVGLIRHSGHRVERLQQVGRLHLSPEGLVEDREDIAAAVDAAEGGIDCQTEVLISEWQRQSVRLDTQV